MTPLSALLGALGMVFFAFGLLSLMLGLFGAPTLGSWIGINFLAGIALLVVALVVNLEHLRERMRSGEGGAGSVATEAAPSHKRQSCSSSSASSGSWPTVTTGVST